MTTMFFFEFECNLGVTQISGTPHMAAPFNNGKFLFTDDDFFCTVSEGVNIIHGGEDFFRGVVVAPDHETAENLLAEFMNDFEPPF